MRTHPLQHRAASPSASRREPRGQVQQNRQATISIRQSIHDEVSRWRHTPTFPYLHLSPRPKKKEPADERYESSDDTSRDRSPRSTRPIKSIVLQHPSSSQDNRMVFFSPAPPPPASFSVRPEFTHSSSLSKASNSQNDRSNNIFSYTTVSSAQQSGYQPYRFESSPISSSHEQPAPPTDRFQAHRYGSQVIHDYPPKANTGKSSLSFHNQKPSRPPIPRQFLQMNVSGSLI